MTHAAHPQHFDGHNARSGQVRVASAINFLAGVYVLISAWIGAHAAGNEWNSIIAGIVVAILAATRFSGATGPWGDVFSFDGAQGRMTGAAARTSRTLAARDVLGPPLASACCNCCALVRCFCNTGSACWTASGERR